MTMRRLLVLACLLAASTAHAGAYVLRDLTERMARDFPTVAAARESVLSAQAALRAAHFMWLPVGDLNFFVSGAPNVKCIGKAYDPNPADTDANVPLTDKAAREADCLRTNVVSLNDTARGSQLIDVAPIHGVLLRLDISLNQPLYSSGRIEAAIAAAQANLETAQANLAVEQAEAVLRAERAYFGVKAARAALGTLNDGKKKLREWVGKMNEQLDAPGSKYTESDLARLKVSLAFLMTQVHDQERNLAVAQDGLRLLTNDAQADVDADDLDLVDVDPGELDVWQKRAVESRPELRLVRASEQLAKSGKSARRSDLLPELSFNTWFGVGYASSIDTPQNYFFNRANYVNATFGLNLHQPLDFGVRTARFLQARHDLHATELRAQASRIVYSTEIAKAYEDYREARARADEAAHGERVARGWFNSIDTNISSGLTSDAREAVEAAQSYFAFRMRSLQAIYDANIAFVWLERVTAHLK